jgi:hypothetical protein
VYAHDTVADVIALYFWTATFAYFYTWTINVFYFQT